MTSTICSDTCILTEVRRSELNEQAKANIPEIDVTPEIVSRGTEQTVDFKQTAYYLNVLYNR